MDHFDLVAGTSTGGIIALGLGLGIPVRKIVQFYKEQGPKIMEASWNMTNLLTGQRSVRVDATVEPGIYSLDAAAQLDRMIILGRAEAAKWKVWEPVKSRFLNGQPGDEFKRD